MAENVDECEHLVPRPLCRQGCAGNKRSGPGESASVASDAVPDDRKQSDVDEHRITEPPSKEGPPGTKKSGSEPSDLLAFKLVNDDVPPTDGARPPGARASEEPIIEGGEAQFDIEDVESTNTPDAERGNPSPQEEIAEKTAAPLRPHKVDISRHLFELFPPAFVKDYPDAQVEIAYADMAGSAKPDAAKNFSVFDLQAAAHFAETKNIAGCNVYVGAALRNAKSNGRASRTDVLTSCHSWADFDDPGDDKRVDLLLKEKSVLPAVFVETGRTPHRRFQIYVKLAGNATSKEVAEANAALETWLGGDNVKSSDHLTRLAGTINYPTKGKRKRGYVAELVTLHINLHAPAYTVEQLTSLTSKPRSQFSSDAAKPGRNDDQLRALLGASRMDGHWHNSMRAAIATMIGRGWSDDAIRFTCKRYCRDGYDDPDLAPLIDGARRKWDKPGNSDAQGGAADSSQSRPPRFLTLDEWRERDLPMPDYLLGETFSTTCRAIMSAPTGLGKSNVTIAIGMRMAAGLPFLHWAGRRSARVLYIDGEMSRRLLRQRLLAEETRLFAEVSDQVREQFKPSGFHALSTEDIPNFQPLNTAMGQAAVEELIAEIGGCDFIIFDNVMSLISGSMVDEEAWAQTLPWAKSLTKRGIGQLWVHHTGHDETKGYGTKTREWQMDVVIHLTKTERDDTDVSFKLEFRKARERRPDNRETSSR